MSVCQLFAFYYGSHVLWALILLSLQIAILLVFRTPEVFQHIEADAKKIRYEHSRLDPMFVSDASVTACKRTLYTVIRT